MKMKVRWEKVTRRGTSEMNHEARQHQDSVTVNFVVKLKTRQVVALP